MTRDLQHGGALDLIQAQFPAAPGPWLDLSTGINPWPWPVDPADLSPASRLPTAAQFDRCRRAISTATGAPAATLTLVPGTELAIRLLPRIIPARRVAVLSPSYADHAASWHAAGAEVIATTHPLAEADRADVIVLCNPNNPDGRTFQQADLLAAHRTLMRRGGWLIVDEAYADLTPELSLAGAAGTDHLLVLRSLGKFFGLPGLRLGAVAAPASLRTRLQDLLGHWAVSSVALEVGASCYEDLAWQSQTRAKLRRQTMLLDALLRAHELEPVGGTDLFRYVQVPEAHERWAALARAGVYVRRFADSNAHLRIGLPARLASLQARLNL